MKKEKIQELISRMTLEEKAGMCSGADFWHLKGIERLGIPQVMVTDGPHGIRKQAEEADHLGINESDDCFTFSLLTTRFVRVDIDLVKHLCVVFDTPGISSVSINLIVCLNERDTREGRWRLDIFASHIDFRVFLSHLCGHDTEYLCLNVNHPNTSFAID